MRRMLVGAACAALALFACDVAPTYSGNAYFILQFDPPPAGYDTYVTNNQRDFYATKAAYPDKTFLAYYNITATQLFDNAIQRAMREEAREWYLFDGGDSVVDAGRNTVIMRWDDTDYAVWYAEWIDQYNGDWDGIYFDQMFGRWGVQQNWMDSLTTYTAYSEAELRDQWVALRDTLITNTRRLLGPDKVIIANCGYPAYYSSGMNGLTIEAGHMTTQTKIDETEAILQQYVVPGNMPIRNIAWDWTSYWANTGAVNP